VLSQVSLGRARPSYNRVSPAAQFRQLNRSAAGRRSLELAGVSPADRTAKRWLSRAQQPSKANREGIARAYQAAQRGGIPDWFKGGRMEITGRVAYGPDVRDRGEAGNAPLRVDLSQADQLGGGGTVREDGRSHWEAVEDLWADMEDDDLEELIAEELIAEDIGDGYPWGFPGGAYTVTVSGR
jgi:hypothetical protein